MALFDDFGLYWQLYILMALGVFVCLFAPIKGLIEGRQPPLNFTKEE